MTLSDLFRVSDMRSVIYEVAQENVLLAMFLRRRLTSMRTHSALPTVTEQDGHGGQENRFCNQWVKLTAGKSEAGTTILKIQGHLQSRNKAALERDQGGVRWWPMINSNSGCTHPFLQ
jgi:hypothetical protein